MKNPATKFFKNLKAIEKDTRTLNQLVRENTNTKRDFREIAIKLRSTVSMITTVEMLSVVGKPIITQDVEDEDAGKIYRKEVSTQTETVNQDTGREKAEEKITRELIERCRTYYQYEEIKELDWEQEAYIKTNVIEGNPITHEREQDLMTWIDKEDINMEKGIQKMIRERFPELAGQNKSVYVVNQRKVINQEGEVRETTRHVLSVEMGDTEEQLYENMTTAINKLNEKARRKAAISSDEVDMGAKLRKMLECILWDKELEVDIYIPVGSKKRNKQQTENEAGNKPKNSREDTRALIVRQEWKTYADLSRQLKITSMPIR